MQSTGRSHDKIIGFFKNFGAKKIEKFCFLYFSLAISTCMYFSPRKKVQLKKNNLVYYI